MSASLQPAIQDASASPTPHATYDLPSVALFGVRASERDSLRAHIPLAASVISTSSRPLTVAAAPAVDCVVVAYPPGGELHDLPSFIRALAERCQTPVVAYGDVAPRERAELVRIGCAAVVAPATPTRTLWGEVQRAVSASLIARTATRLGDVRLGAELRAALTMLCIEDPPPASVTSVCAAVGAHRRTVWYQWHQRIRGSRRPRFEDVVTTAVLMRAFMRRSRGASWSETASYCGIHRHTLARGAHRLLGLERLPPPTGAAADAAQAAARRAFAQNVVRPVLRKQTL